VLDASVCRVDTGDKRADARDRRYHRTDQSRTGGVVEIHPWGSTIYKLAKPDRLVFDLAPGENVPWMVVIEAGCPRGPKSHSRADLNLLSGLSNLTSRSGRSLSGRRAFGGGVISERTLPSENAPASIGMGEISFFGNQRVQRRA
jgi:hypothetical protein